MNMKAAAFAAFVVIGGGLVSSCLNMPTPENQITGAYVSGLNYEQFDCARLLAEMDSLNRREAQLAAAQTQRVKSSQMQAFWWGFGQGDSVEATQLADVRGQQEAVRTAIANKQCNAAPAPSATPAPTAAPTPATP
jgi:hypothetical protein